MEELDTEKFQAVKELAEIQGNIAKGLAELTQLKSTKEEYFLQREKEVLTIVDKVLTASKAAIQEANSNHDTIASLLASTKDTVKLIKDLQNEFAEQQAEYKKMIDLFFAKVQERQKELDQALKSIEESKRVLKEDQAIIEQQKKQIARDRIWIADRKQLLATELDRIKKA